MEDRTVDTSKDNKLILAILQEEDYDQTVEMLNAKHFFVTKLSSSGGFLKKKNVTIMIGVEEERLPEVSAILEKYAGRRRITMYTMASSGAEVRGMNPGVTIPVEKEVGGVTMFTLSMDALKKF